jgi:hypothetical protein
MHYISLTVSLTHYVCILSSHYCTVVRNAKHQQVYIGVTSAFIVVACSYPVFFKETRPGHEIFSSDKPEVIREAQEAQRDEYRRLIKDQRKELQEEQAALKQKQQQN